MNTPNTLNTYTSIVSLLEIDIPILTLLTLSLTHTHSIDALCRRRVESGRGSVYFVPLRPLEAQQARDAMAKVTAKNIYLNKGYCCLPSVCVCV